MHNDNDDDIYPLQSTSTALGLFQSTNSDRRSRTSVTQIQNPILSVLDDTDDLGKMAQESTSSFSKTDLRFYSRSRENSHNETKLPERAHASLERVFSRSDFVVSDCWKTTSKEIPAKLIQLLESNTEEEETGGPVKKRRLASEENNRLYHTKEFHVLTEIQKAKILSVVEDTIKKLANKDVLDYGEKLDDISLEKSVFGGSPINIEKLCKKIILPWIIIKVVEMVLCHMIQFTFLSEESYFERKGEFLPIVVTYYLTLFIIIFSLILHTSCFSYTALRNPCYIMSVISCSILTLTTTLGLLIMLISMKYYKSFQQIFVLAFIGCLLSSLFVELCLSYCEVKHIWNRMEQTCQNYVA